MNSIRAETLQPTWCQPLRCGLPWEISFVKRRKWRGRRKRRIRLWLKTKRRVGAEGEKDRLVTLFWRGRGSWPPRWWWGWPRWGEGDQPQGLRRPRWRSSTWRWRRRRRAGAGGRGGGGGGWHQQLWRGCPLWLSTLTTLLDLKVRRKISLVMMTMRTTTRRGREIQLLQLEVRMMT